MIGICNSEGRYLTENMNGDTFKVKFDKAGSYAAYVTAYNSVGGYDSKWIDFLVYDKNHQQAYFPVISQLLQ